MKKKHIQLVTILLVITLLLYIEPAYAGPGGTITKALFKTWWGKLLITIISIILLPVLLYCNIVIALKVRKTKKILTQIGLKNRAFSWLNLEKDISNVFSRTYEAWNNEDMSKVQDYVTHWYWQNQQSTILNKWKSQNLKNICNLDEIKSIKPLYVEIFEDKNLEGSKIAVLIKANIEDYLIERDTHKIIKGGLGYIDEEHIWILEFTEGKWLLDNIVSDDNTLVYAKTENIIPNTLFA